MVSKEDAKIVLRKQILQPALQDALRAAVKEEGFEDYAPYLFPFQHTIWSALNSLKQGGTGAGWGQFKIKLGDAHKATREPLLSLIPMGLKPLRENLDAFLVSVFKRLT